MDFPFMKLFNKVVDIKNKTANKKLKIKESIELKKSLKQEKKKQLVEEMKKIEIKNKMSAPINPDRFISSEEEMLKRFRIALAASNSKSNAGSSDITKNSDEIN